MLKKIFALSLMSLMLFSAVACGNKDVAGNENEAGSKVEENANTETTEASADNSA